MVDEEKSKKVIEALHKILRPFLLRQVKTGVEKSLLPSALLSIFVFVLLLTARHSTEKEINIYVGLTEMQQKWYRSVLEKDIDAVNGKFHSVVTSIQFLSLYTGLTGKKEGNTRLMNMVMQQRKVTCHPYLFDGAVHIVIFFSLSTYTTGPRALSDISAKHMMWPIFRNADHLTPPTSTSSKTRCLSSTSCSRA